MDYIALRVGTTLHMGTFSIQKVLGQGGFGITYLAHDNNLDKQVAIKEFFPSSLCSRDGSTSHVTLGTQSTAELVTQLKEKFMKEARNIARLNHPNIIKILTAFEENNTAYYVMEYIKGESLDQKVTREGPMSQEQALRYINAIGHALEYLHENRMMHFDVKPANIMVRDSDNCPILIDFGLSKNYDSQGRQTTIHGPLGVSPGYSPIEQYNMGDASQFSPRSDLYALAATMYFLLTGQHPKEATMNVAGSLTFPPGVSAHVIRAIRKAMAMLPDDRHATVADFLREINNPQGATQIVASANPVEASYSTQIVNQANNFSDAHYDSPVSKSRKPVIIAAVCVFVIACAFGIWLLLDSNNDNGYRGLTPAENTVSESRDYDNKDTSDEEEESEEVAAEVLSPFGPFDSKSELIDFLEGFYEDSRPFYPSTSRIASKLTTNYGTEQVATIPEYLERTERYRDRIGYVDGVQYFEWNTLKTKPLEDGGVKAHFYHTYDLTRDKGEGEYVTTYGLTTDVYINPDRKIYRIEEKTKKLD